MKYIITILLSVFSLLESLSQCTANAGLDFAICTNQYGLKDSIQLGGNPTATNGSLPYQYIWSIEPIPFWPGSNSYYHASDFLNDTSLANPFLVNFPVLNDSLEFRLTVIDNNNDSCFDSLIGYLSYSVISLVDVRISINKGDSVYLNQGSNISVNWPIKDLVWRPNHGLLDSTSFSGFWAKPDSSINYFLTITDSLGCEHVAPPFYIIGVNNIGLNELALSDRIEVHPNPFYDFLNISKPKDLQFLSFSIYNSNGQLILHRSGKTQRLDMVDLNQGVYFCFIETVEGVVSKIIVKK